MTDTQALKLDETAREQLLERFLRYVRIDTQADEHSDSSPSSPKQLELSRLLEQECQTLGLADVERTSEGVVYATLKPSQGVDSPTICWFAHVDTSPEYTAEKVSPIVHRDYSGNDIPLPNGENLTIRVADNPTLNDLVGGTIITTDGSTLLGADDKSGIAVILSAASWLKQHPEIPHGEIRICFTTDEEIGRGCEGLDLNRIGSVCGYTLDGSGTAEIDVETFSADLCVVTVQGVNTHPSIGKGVMVNALRVLSDFLTRLPHQSDSPETSDGRDGFLHPYAIDGGVAEANVRIIIRDFEQDGLTRYRTLLKQLADDVERSHPGSRIVLEFREQYRNMRDGLASEPRAIELARQAVVDAGLEPKLSIIRGGTDGSQLTALGLPTPNLSSGQHNPHSPLEWTSVGEMARCVSVLLHLANRWGRESQPR
ncbi:peptidase T [Stratiformator vulcanicus]|uniref:peptidase T n=1 Tax=Stratiformator vulcanicus TaxID=2527980 RepID=UPI002877DDA1|nr:peptidase T [Stratiformator vulcanicus]